MSGHLQRSPPRLIRREIVPIADGWIPFFSRAFECLSASRILHRGGWIPIFMNHTQQISTTKIHLFILPSVFDSGSRASDAREGIARIQTEGVAVMSGGSRRHTARMLRRVVAKAGGEQVLITGDAR